MKIRKLYMALVGILMSMQLANAQQNMLLVGNNGEINAISVSSVDYATFNANKLLTISNDSIEPDTTFITAVCTVAPSSESNVKTLSFTPEVGVCYSKYNSVPTIDDDDCLSLGSELKSYTFTLKSLISGTTYYFRPYVKLAGGVVYGDVAKAKTLGTTPNDKTINGHKFIDLGLPSGLLWAETNIGAATAADDGHYYAWGETTSKDTYYENNYKFYKTSSSYYTKYTVGDLDKEDDAAYVNRGSSCRMPTTENFLELVYCCTWTWTTKKNSSGSFVGGYKVTGKNGNSIFLPASGYCTKSNRKGHGSLGHYWARTLYPYDHHCANYLSFSSSDLNFDDYGYRYYGRTVRPVAEP